MDSSRIALQRHLGACLLALVFSGCSDSVTPPRVNTSPTAAIRSPAAGASFRAGDSIFFAGDAVDGEDGAIPSSRLSWWADFHHDDHAHPFMSLTTGVASGVVAIPTRGETSENVWYRFYLVARDAEGAVDTVSRDVQPQTSTLLFATQPQGLEVRLDGQPRSTPFSVTSVVGMERDISVSETQVLNGTSYEFVSWTQGGAAAQTIIAGAEGGTYAATFSAGGAANQPPVVGVTDPPQGSVRNVNTTISVTANASDNDGTVVEVRFTANGQSIGIDNTSPYAAQWTPSATGAYRLAAAAIDDDGTVAVSDTVVVNVTAVGGGDTQSPTIQMTAPADNEQNLQSPLAITADANDNVGVAGVLFQVDGVDAGGEDTTAPYGTGVSSLAGYVSGVHVVRARARDTSGNLSDWSTVNVTFGGSTTVPAGFSSSPYGGALSDLGTAMAFTPDGRLLVAEKSGAIRIIRDGVLLEQNFATFSVNADGERGLLGIAVHPQFATNGWVYVHYTAIVAGTARGRISRVTASGDVATGGETVIATLSPDVSIFHNGGALHFGPDGRLYVATGDDATSSNSQSMSTLHGKILRLNDDGSIPSDNPFYTIATAENRAIWALGLRNPYTFGFQPGTGRMFINDVGDGAWEEINEGAAGRNFGWPETEGPTADSRFSTPVYAYRHHDALMTGFSITGAAFYNPPVQLFPTEYSGNYFFADYVSHWISRLDTANGADVYAFARMPAGITDLRVGPDGALYVLLATSFTSAQVQRISYSP